MSRAAGLAARAHWAGPHLMWGTAAPTPLPPESAPRRFACLVEDHGNQTCAATVYDVGLGSIYQTSEPSSWKCIHIGDFFHIDFDRWLSGALAPVSAPGNTDADRRARTVAMLDGWLAEAHSKEAEAELAELKRALIENRRGERRLFPE
jgi:hypothetical protein